MNKSVLMHAIEQLSLSKEETAKYLGVSETRLDDIVAGDGFPTLNQLRKFSYHSKVPFNLFFAPKVFGPKLPLRDFRSLDGEKISASAMSMLADCERRRQAFIALSEEDEGNDFALSLPGGTRSRDDVLNAVEAFRDFLGFSSPRETGKRGYDQLNHLIGLLFEKDVLTFQMSLDTGELRGAALYHDRFPIIVVSTKDAVNGRIFSLFHELTHLGLRQGGLCDHRRGNSIEVFCNAVAGEFLVSREELLGLIGGGSGSWDLDELDRLASHFAVSKEVVLRSLLESNRTTAEHYREWRAKWHRENEARETGNTSIPVFRKVLASYGRPFVRQLLTDYYSDRVTLSDVSQALNMKVRHLPDLESAAFK